MTHLHRYVCACLLLSPLAAQAQEPCQIQLDQANLDYGQLQLPTGSTVANFQQLHALEQRHIRVRVHCPQPSPLALDLVGVSQDGRLKFADTGHIRLQAQDASVDGAGVDLANLDNAAPGQRVLEVKPGQRIVPSRDGQAVQGSDWSLTLQVAPSLPLGELRSVQDTLLEGTLTLAVPG